MNPFRYGDPVEGDFFLTRASLHDAVSNFLENKINVVLIGPRRFGKTSFILNLLKQLETKDVATLYVDVFNVTSHRDFLQQLLDKLSKKKSVKNKFKDWLKKSVSRLQPEIDFQSQSVSLSLSEHQIGSEDVKQLIMDAFDEIPKLGDDVCVVFDEFQTVGSLDDNGWLEVTIRGKMQLHRNTAYLFSGSRHGILHDMFNTVSRPFYRSCQLVDFPAFGPEFDEWLIDRFRRVSVSCDPSAMSYLRAQVDHTPNYMQMVCFHIVALGYERVDREVIQTVLNQIASQSSYAYQTLLNSVTTTQQRVLRLAAIETKGLFAKQVLQKYEIKSAAHVSQAFVSLSDKQIIDSGPGRGQVTFDDPLFAYWLRMMFSREV